jgi:hypothetical protein
LRKGEDRLPRSPKHIASDWLLGRKTKIKVNSEEKEERKRGEGKIIDF